VVGYEEDRIGFSGVVRCTFVGVKQNKNVGEKSTEGKHWVLCSGCGLSRACKFSENFATVEGKCEPHSVASYYCLRTVVL